jgi:divalent metal cation (Fe/Co/Zn/Cd) transporter
MTSEKTAIRATYFSIIGNLALAVIKGLAGFFGNSYALIADAIESTTDIFASLLVLFGIKYSNKPADDNHPYGHGRAEPLITFIVVGDWAALFASGFIVYNSYKIFRPALGEIMDEHLYDDLIAQIREVSLEVNGIIGTEKCFIRKAGMQYHVDLHATVDSKITVKEGHDLAHKLKDTLRERITELGQVLIHVEPNE